MSNADAAWFGERLNSRSDVHAVAEHVILALHHIAQMNADTNLDFLLPKYERVVVREHFLNCNAAVHGGQGAGKLDQKSVPGRFDFASLVFG